MIFTMGSMELFGQSTEDSVKQVVNRLFTAMKEADSAGVVNVFADVAVLQAIAKDKVVRDSYQDFGSSIGKFIHCGANSFQLARLSGEWKIVHLIDTRRKDCN